PKSDPPVLELPTVKKVKLHPHYDTALEAIKLLKSLARDQNSWELYSESKGVKVYLKDIPGKSVPCMRGDITIYGDFLPDDICSYTTSLDARKLWDDRYEEGTTVERYSLTDVMTRSAMKGTFPISGRDFAMICTIDRDPDGTIWCVAKSIVDSKIPENKKYVRAELNLAGWELRPVYDSAGNRIAVDIKYIVDIDIKLDSVPSRVLKSISMQTPMCVVKIDELLKNIGFPPYIRYTTGEIIHEEFNTDNFQYDLILTNNGEEKGITELRTSNKMYSNGLNISIRPTDVKVDLHPNDSGVFCITVPAGINAKELSILITKNTSREVQITYNGSKLLRPIYKNENGDNKLTTASVSKIDVQSKRTREVPQVHQDQQISKQVDIQPNTSKKISLSTEINNTEINHNKNGDNVVPKESSKMYKQSSDLIFWSEQIKFDYKQLGLMFASMLLAYQAGKLSGC
ncbi:3423_t:CDS:2, partial [Dentiscutata heterogama]